MREFIRKLHEIQFLTLFSSTLRGRRIDDREHQRKEELNVDALSLASANFPCATNSALLEGF